jgi:hypothetical protein
MAFDTKSCGGAVLVISKDMAAFSHSLRALPCSFVLMVSVLLGGCGKDHATEQQAQATKAELESSTAKLAAVEKKAEAATDQLEIAKEELAKAKGEIAAKDKELAKRDTQIVALQKDMDALKNQDAAMFAEATLLRKQGNSLSALNLYQKLVTDFPQSPLVAYSTTAVTELTAERSKAAQKRVDDYVAAKRPEHQVLKYFGDGQTTIAELAPVMKNKTVQEVVKMIGRPDRTFNEGNEFGYADKALNPATNRPGMLIIGFVDGVVANLRVEYAGRKVVP